MKLEYKLFFIVFFLINILLFYLYKIIAKEIGIVDNSKKFKNPITPTSAGIIIYLNFLFFFIFINFSEINFKYYLPNNYFYTFFFLTFLVIISLIDDSKPFFLLGYSFGGIIVQEINRKKPAAKTIILGSIKSQKEK
jgi:UDP-N-acetylmuramyl pentapeptide phosphotransferase/UDP-N-acetylglucosamine-1-phosphate transferase